MSKKILLVVLLFPSILCAGLDGGDCYIVGNQKGYSAKHYKNDYKPFPDKISDVTVKVRVAGDRSETSSSDRDASASRCFEIASNTIFCVAGTMRVSEIIAVYPTEGKVITTTVYPEHHPFAGASLLVGDILSRCE
ncbi:MAG: hypothetical protein KUF75_06855 [Candidatus Thiodiazotropha sp. (ex Ctena orbiculata)]|nr:hypothetical protein [Candidatus Thiodiazotropha taylori]